MPERRPPATQTTATFVPSCGCPWEGRDRAHRPDCPQRPATPPARPRPARRSVPKPVADAFAARFTAASRITVLAGQLTGPEAEALAGLLAALGHKDAAAAWRNHHR